MTSNTSNIQYQVPSDHPLMVAWETYKVSDHYRNSRRWALHDDHVDGSLWAAFEQGWAAALIAENELRREDAAALAQRETRDAK